MEKQLTLIDQKKQALDSLRPLPQELIKNLEQWFDVERSLDQYLDAAKKVVAA